MTMGAISNEGGHHHLNQQIALPCATDAAAQSTQRGSKMSKGASALVGKTLTKVELASDKKAIRFTVDGETVVAKCDGDCCSDTWIESVEMPAGGLPAKISEATDLDMPGGTDELARYGLKLATDKGDLVLDYRNESNGYYGGNLSWPGDHHYGGVYGQNNSTEEWASIEPQVNDAHGDAPCRPER
jgi:hypothetical protein